MTTVTKSKAKYFDFLPKYGAKLESFLGIPNLVDAINTYRAMVNQIPNEVAIGTRRYSEIAARKIALNVGINQSNMNYVNVLRELKRRDSITTTIADLFHKLRKNGNIAAHENGIIPVSEAVESLITLDKLLRVFAYNLSSNKSFDPGVEINDEMFVVTYNTFDRKLIYIQSARDTDGTWKMYQGLEKIGDASVPEDYEADFTPNSEYLRKHATKRIKQYMTTAGVPFVVHWAQLAVNNKNQFFRDHDVHEVLKRSGYNPQTIGEDDVGKPNEWFNVTVDIAKEAIQAVKDGKGSLKSKTDDFDEFQINFRPEQKDAINQTKKVFKTKDEMLWNAKMRFGKTLSALQVIKESGYKKVLIMTHRPVVSDGWFNDFKKIFTDDSYIYGSRQQGERIKNLVDTDKPFVYFASIQDLRGSEWAGGKQGDKNHEFLAIGWDLIIIDEAHEGNETELANNVKAKLREEHTKVLELSGTPFNLFDKYDDDNIFTWDYTMEQEAKERWSVEHPNEPNPYEGLPKVSMYTFEIPNKFDYFDENKAFNFREFFRVKEDDETKLIHEDDVRKFLDYITTNDAKTNFPFSKQEFRENLRHTLWLMPGVKEANAFERVLATHPVFKEYNIANVVKTGDSEHASDSDLQLVRNAIGENPAKSKTITLTVRKLTTGVNVPEWTGVFFLSNTESPTSYLQAAFRAQTPFNHAELGVKKNCYIFDFAPDRALKIMSESVGLTSKKGKVNSLEQKKKLENMLNFFPILGQQGNTMKEFSVDRMLTALKKAYAEKAVNTGFEDTSLYNDNLLNLDQVDLTKFEELKKIVGSSKPTKHKDFIVSENGMDIEEYEKGSKGERKEKKDRTPEEQAAVEKIKKLREQRTKMISVLRGVSIRIPMMIYGMDVDIKDEITLDMFINLVDEKSWNEFMPMGLTKEKFKDFTKYYDGEVFVEAGRIIRQKAKSYDELDVIPRTEKIAKLFSSFKNPDKETVLTPWRVVNMHSINTLGGLSFFDNDFQNNTIDGQLVYRWVNNFNTKKIYTEETTFLDMNSKTGLYPLFVATSLYQKLFEEINNQKAGRVNGVELVELWKKVLKNNVYAVAKTPMAKTITKRTLAGFKDYSTNIEYVEDLTKQLKDSVDEGVNLIKEAFHGVKFDVIISNPPYQEMDGGAQASASPIYQNFVKAGKELNPSYMTQITPSRWYVGGKGLDDYRDEMLNDPHLRELHDWLTPEDIFPKTNIRGGICYFLWDKKYDNTKNLTRVVTYEDNKVIEDVMRSMKIEGVDVFVRDSKAVSILKKIITLNGELLNDNWLSKFTSPLKPFGFRGYFIKDPRFHADVDGLNEPIKCYGKGVIGYVERDEITTRQEWINDWKVYTARANNIGTELNDDNLNSFVGEPSSICTETYIVLGAELKLDEGSATNLTKYLKTKFVRYLHGLSKGSQDATAKTYRFVPLQDFSIKSDIDWTKPVSDLDAQLVKKYGIDKDEAKHIDNKIKSM
ncbi:Eco57I restriction-modification methylase domain-containing protein [Enterococcus raffinosus]|uniref:Eco57I restriction-modification methylase domain-containing protein n=1 Tax=Enterococcus raffinosus TaxID=71452 RepID=UPI001C104C38|nr:Eco57I restriction-modification methylase domain-containing protein [Enterococcus raffinosus]MBU5361617.1 Eco57I restriction-modification methylase domain-containing protein [Enterococcus raffinosus]